MRRGRFSEYDEDSYRLPEGMQRIAYDADTQCYTFCDESGRLYGSAPGCRYGVLHPLTATHIPHRRNVTITEIPDPALRQWSDKPAKTFGDIIPPSYTTAAQPSVKSAVSEKFIQATVPKVQGIIEIVRRHTTIRRSTRGVKRSDSVTDEKRRLLEDDSWEIIQKSDVPDARLARSKSEMRPSRYSLRK